MSAFKTAVLRQKNAVVKLSPKGTIHHAKKVSCLPKEQWATFLERSKAVTMAVENRDRDKDEVADRVKSALAEAHVRKVDDQVIHWAIHRFRMLSAQMPGQDMMRQWADNITEEHPFNAQTGIETLVSLTQEVHDAFTDTHDPDTIPKISHEEMKKLVEDLRIRCVGKGLPHPSDELLRSLLNKRNKHVRDLHHSRKNQTKQAQRRVSYPVMGGMKVVFREHRAVKLLSKKQRYG